MQLSEHSRWTALPSSPVSTFVQRRNEKTILGGSYPSSTELTLLWLFAAACFIAVFKLLHHAYFAGVGVHDHAVYVSTARAIQHWDFRGVQPKQFWGLSYVIAGLSSFHLSARISLLLICLASSLGSILLIQNLWGAWIAAYFAVVNFVWLQVSLLGGSEPLFVFLLFSSFWLSRKQHWLYASLLAALATLVRPVGLFALLGIGATLVLQSRREYKKAFQCMAIAILIGLLYLSPFWIYFHDPLYQFHRYQQTDWESGFAIGWPLRAIVVSYLHNRESWMKVIFTAGWLGFAVAGLCRMGAKGLRQRMSKPSNEYIFAIGYLIFLFCYNSVPWARDEFPRFVIPALPFLLVAFDQWLPKSRYVICALCVVSSVLAACYAISIRNVVAMLR